MLKKISLLSLLSLLSLSATAAETKFGNVHILGSLQADSTLSFQNNSISQASLSGLTTTDTPSFYSATLTGRPLQISSGGTGATSASAARTSLGLGNVENTALSSWAGSANITTLGTISTGTIPQANVSGLTTSDTASFLGASLTNPLPVASGGTGARSSSAARSSLGLGTAATQDTTAFDSAGAALSVQQNLDTHTSLTGTSVHGLGTAATTNSTAYATAAQGSTADSAYAASVTNATNNNTASTIVKRDASGNFSAGTITATLSGNASTVTNGVYTSGSYANPSWITSLDSAKVTGLGNMSTQTANNVSISGGSVSGITDLAVADGGTGSSTAAAAIVAIGGKAANGFVDRTNSTLGMSGSSFQITTSGSYDFYTAGTKYTKSTTQNVSISSDLTLHYVYFDTSGVLQVSAGTAWSITSDNVPVAMVYKDGNTYCISDERHGWKRDRDWHAWAHETIGARWHTGLGLDTAFTDTTVKLASGEIDDEDIHHAISTQLDSPRIWFRNSTTSMKVRPSNKKPYASLSGTDIAYDNSGTLTQVTNNQYTCVYLYATNDKDYPLYIVAGQNQHTTIAAARTEALPTIQLPSAEWKLLYKAIYKSNGASAPTYQEASDFRTTQTLALTATATDHQSLANRDAANSHTQAAITGLTTSDTATFLGATLTNPLPIASGGTAATTAANARSSLGAEATITAGTTAQYWRGDKSFQTLNQAAVSGLTTSDTPSFLGVNVTGSMPPTNGIYLPAANSFGIATNSTGRVRIDSAGNVGINTNPKAWSNVFPAIDLGSGASISSAYNGVHVAGNTYYNGTNWIYKNSDLAALLELRDGFTVYTAQTGIAGNPISLNKSFEINSSGNVGINCTPTVKMTTKGNGRFYTDSGSVYCVVANGTNSLQIATDDTSNTIYGTGAVPVNIASNGVTRMVIDSSGNVIIGTDPMGSEKLRVGGDINIASGSVVKINGTQIITARQSAIADLSVSLTATDMDTDTKRATQLNTTNAKINSILSAMRTHGLIAP